MYGRKNTELIKRQAIRTTFPIGNKAVTIID